MPTDAPPGAHSALIESALAHFGRSGFDGASTRRIAEDAGQAMSQIRYHFGGKHGLYLACADHIVASVRERQGPFIASLAQALDNPDPYAVRSVMKATAASFARMFADPVTEDWARFITREQQEPSEAFDRLWNGLMGPVLGSVARLVARFRPDLPDERIRVLAMQLFGQVIILRVAHAAVARLSGEERVGPATVAAFIAQLEANIDALLQEPQP